jgi:hypothetical protein
MDGSGNVEELGRLVDELAVSIDADELAAAFGVWDRLGAKLHRAAGELDAVDGWAREGATSLTSWLRDRAGMSGRTAASVTHTARRLRLCPVTAEAWEGGQLSGGQVQAICANVNDAAAPLYQEHEGEVVPSLAELSVADTAQAMRSWAVHAEQVLAEQGRLPDEPTRVAHLSKMLDGRRRLDADLDPEGGEVVASALRLAEVPTTRSPAQRRGDALVDVCRWFLDHQHGHRGGRHRPHLNAVVELDPVGPLAEGAAVGAGPQGRLTDGTALDAATVQRLLCDAGVHRVVTSGASALLDYGTTTRTIPAALFAALVVRDGGCRWPGCDRTPDWCEGHHLVPWNAGGPTAIGNLALLCTRHHHRGHIAGWTVELLTDATLEVTTPTGQVLTSRPHRRTALRRGRERASPGEAAPRAA